MRTPIACTDVVTLAAHMRQVRPPPAHLWQQSATKVNLTPGLVSSGFRTVHQKARCWQCIVPCWKCVAVVQMQCGVGMHLGERCGPRSMIGKGTMHA